MGRDDFRPRVVASSRSVWRLRLGIEALLKRGRVSRREMETIVVHLTFKSLFRRELLSVGRGVFYFGDEARPHRRLELDREVRQELWQWRSLLHLAARDLAATWSSKTVVFDA